MRLSSSPLGPEPDLLPSPRPPPPPRPRPRLPHPPTPTYHDDDAHAADYMIAAWKAELAVLAADGISQDEMLMAAAARDDAHELPWFAGTHVYPLYPGPAAK